MNHLRVHAMVEEMVKAILNAQHGFVHVGNVWLTWDTPLSEWNIEAVWQSLMQRATQHPDVERIASCAHNLANL